MSDENIAPLLDLLNRLYEKDQENVRLKHENECLKIQLKFAKEGTPKIQISDNLMTSSESFSEDTTSQNSVFSNMPQIIPATSFTNSGDSPQSLASSTDTISLGPPVLMTSGHHGGSGLKEGGSSDHVRPTLDRKRKEEGALAAPSFDTIDHRLGGVDWEGLVGMEEGQTEKTNVMASSPSNFNFTQRDENQSPHDYYFYSGEAFDDIKLEIEIEEKPLIAEIGGQDNDQSLLDKSFCEEVTPPRKKKCGPEWTLLKPNLIKLKKETGPSTIQQNESEELLAVNEGGKEPKKIQLYSCSLCSYEMTNASSIASHIESKHGESGKKLKCIFPLCNHSAYKDDLIRHIRAKHTREELFDCDECFKWFYTYRAFKDHVEKHRYQSQCEKCKRFYRYEKCGTCKV